MTTNENKLTVTTHSDIDDHDMSGDSEPGPVNHEMSSMHVKLQPFWIDNPRDWFNMAEIIFDLEKIKSDSKRYALVLSALSPRASHKISDLLASPPKTNCYETIKQAFLDRLAPSAERKLTELLSGQNMGDMRPTEILRHIRVLAENQLNDSVIKQLWLRKLPEIIKIAMIAQPEITPLERLAKIADNMNEHITTSSAIAAVSASSFTPSTKSYRPPLNTSTSNNSVEARLARLELVIKQIFNDRRSRSRGRYSSRSGSRNPSSNRSPSRNRYTCWYHTKFGKDAKRCQKPCNFSAPVTTNNTSNIEVDFHQKNASTTG